MCEAEAADWNIAQTYFMVSKLSSAEVLNFLIIVSLILISSRVLGEFFRKLKQPAVIGEILAGILLGPSLLGTYSPQLFHSIFLSESRSFAAFDGLSNVGIIMLMFVAGLEVDIKQIRSQFKQAASISIMGLLIPFSIGFGMVWFFHDFLFAQPTHDKYIPAMFFGTALSITALSVIAKILMDLNILRSKIGNLVLTAAMIDDFLGWILFSIIMQLLNVHGEKSSFATIGYILLFVLFLMTLGRWIVDKLLMLTDRYLTPPGGLLTVSISLCFLGAVFTEYMGIRGIFGAFLMGIAVGDSKYFSDRIQHILHQFITNIIAPLFFASIGLRINFVTSFNAGIVLFILIASCIAKLLGAGVGARMSGMTKDESLAVAFGMNARGSIAIVLGLSALQAKIIDEQLFVGILVMTVASIIMAGPFMKFYLNRHKSSIEASNEDLQMKVTSLIQADTKAI